MLTFNNDPIFKEMILAEVRAHREADLLAKGSYKQTIDGKEKFCAVGCAIHTLNIKLGKSYDEGDHTVYPKEFGIPTQLAFLQDRFFERLPDEKSMFWPERFFAAIEVGVDLGMVLPKFMLWLMGDIKKFGENYPKVLAAIEETERLYTRVIAGETVSEEEWDSAAAYAADAADAARAARAADAADAAYAADAADAAYAADAARAARAADTADAAYAADAADAAYAAYAADAARAARAADAADAAYAAYAADAAYAAYAAQTEKMADKLIELLTEVKK